MVTTLNYSITAWISHFLACMGGCFGCCTKSTPVIAVDEPSKGLRIQGRSVKKPTVSDDFWSSSTCDLDNSTAISQRSISSISMSNQTVNHGGVTSLLLWNQSRLQWTGGSRSRSQTKQSRERRLRRGSILATGNQIFQALYPSNCSFNPEPLNDRKERKVDVNCLSSVCGNSVELGTAGAVFPQPSRGYGSGWEKQFISSRRGEIISCSTYFAPNRYRGNGEDGKPCRRILNAASPRKWRSMGQWFAVFGKPVIPTRFTILHTADYDTYH
ncbi:hypothetical protein L484_003787 [Morus notabilis]|uniref:DUF4050 domain-containing protein n=1 Tax=Morus notabilis TaxID=981085 RepID=W9QVB2_9ROSA|nr:hypothetical protein L484_003787 [Morus notabilis]